MNAQSKVEAATLSSAMALAFAEIEAATKSANNPHFKSKYADLGAVIDAVKPALIKHGLFYTQEPQPCEDGVSIRTTLRHSSGETIDLGTLFVPANKRDAQGFGSALTYCRRYALMTAFGVPAEDDDGNAAARSAPRADPLPAQTTQMVTDAQRAEIQTIAPSAGKTTQGICEAYKIGSLAQLTEAQAVKLIARLRSEAKEPA
jgi:hypothetical protein